jgi:hypothetical protein
MAPKVKGMAATAQCDGEPCVSKVVTRKAKSSSKNGNESRRTRGEAVTVTGRKGRGPVGAPGRPSRVSTTVKGIAESTNLAAEDVQRVFEAARHGAVKELRGGKEFHIPSLVVLKVSKIKARPASTKDICGKAFELKARESGQRVRAYAVSELNAEVSAQ